MGYIRRYAAAHDARIVAIGRLIVFSTQTGDAWLPDATDRLAACVARGGQPEPLHVEETDANFAIGWKGHDRIEGAAFIYVDRDTRQTGSILGYPARRLEHIERP